MSRDPLFSAADAAMLVTCILWGLGAVVVKLAIGDTPGTFRVFVFNGLRMPLTAGLIFLMLLVTGRSMKLRREDVPYMLALSFFGMFLHIVATLLGLSISGAANMGLIFASIPLLILLLAFGAGVERPTGRLVTGVLMGVAGLALITLKGGFGGFELGDLMFLLACIFWAGYTVFGSRLLDIYSPPAAIAWIFLLTSVWQLPLFLYQLPQQTWSTISAMSWFYFAVGTLGSYFIANTLFFYALGEMGPTRTSIYNNLTPVFMILFAFIIGGETVTGRDITGLIVIMAGIAVTKFPLRRPSEATGDGTVTAEERP